ncbi:hypothetical protein [Cytophaga hutchinsonii]|jgi:hypothetical protein|uniref:Uncharacterized protein n=1 Tax=Cytophaga hutchinsonii (strain ATCC 33406 / DSM 1761 / CIP 103989 / NBRC 15051 / NCIMB 9469 / D465) TaxID=269798 RepID=A0A6N4SMW7_CYTH3|nr:hypothetical protein [Cytophaga hutchinsonii]ABG57625.1 hypothetical protein CHU_0335 [Cytophaga hutchinsonii ATCC 33406]SFX01412.1 hypothetical protein SAMN04487930_101186 [Cytophaga hutchinsonii ATCC 33406]
MKKSLLAFLLMTLFAVQLQVNGQQLAAEKTVDISGKANRGYIGHVERNDQTREVAVTYVTKSTNAKVKFETYTFDYELNLKSTVADEIELTKAKSKYSWFKYKGDAYVVEGLTASPNLTGTFVIKKKQVTYAWNWFLLKYKKSTKTLDKLKFEGENGKNMYYISHYENDSNGEIVALAGEKGNMSKTPYQHFQKHHVFRVTPSLEILSDVTVDLGSPHKLLYSAAVADEKNPDAEQNDWVVVLAPMGGQGMGKYEAADPTKYTVLRISPDGKLVSQSTFTTKAHTWTITGSVIDGSKIYLYGPGFSKGLEKKYYEMAYIPNEADKFTDFQLVRVNTTGADFVSVTSMEEFAAKTRKPDDQKKLSVYNGKRVDIRDLTIGSEGQIYIIAQDFKVDGQGDITGLIYTDLYLFQFDQKGTLLNSFGIDDNSRKGAIIGGGVADARFYPSSSTLFEGKDPNYIYWMQFVPHSTKCVTETTTGIMTTTKTTECRPLKYPRVIKLDVTKGSFVKIAQYGNGEYFLNEDFPLVYIENGTKIIFIGETKGEKGLWVGKFDPSTL